MDRQENPDGYIFPSDPHTLRNIDVQALECLDIGFQPAPGIAPVLTFAIEGSHPIAKRWSQVSDRVVELLDGAGITWVAIECFRRRQQIRQTYEDATIAITVKDLPSNTDSLQAILCEIHNLSGGLFVEIRPGKIWPYASSAPIPMPYSLQTPMGGSVGTNERPDCYGTIGGFVELFKGDDVKMCCLTSDHVVNPQPGTELGDDSVRIFHPSSQDHGLSISRIRQRILLLNEGLEEAREDVDEFGEADETTIRNISSDIKDAQIELNDVENLDRYIGTLFACSGSSVLCQDRRSDWAVIELESGSEGHNSYVSSSGKTKTLQAFRAPSKGCEVSKFGRTTGMTDGVINGVQSLLHKVHKHQPFRTNEWTVVPEHIRPYQPFVRGGGNGLRSDPLFAQGGDSGSFVTHRAHPEVIGMVLCGTDSYGSAFVSPIKQVAKQILAKTSFHVRLRDGPHICCDP
ncbi:hypothetical protein FQN54_002292 [Arachnomyces sp. PD_36]|nr:hypothetical protein FQN54_002292 [Arachnomyces sp. PD_36]